MVRFAIVLVFIICASISFAQDKEKINLALDAWHSDAANAKFENYFKFLSDDAIYMGTDESERWTKQQFMEFAKPFFDKGNAWDFKARDRFVIIGRNADIAWFDELLDTWMGTCRGSGVLIVEDGSWKLKHYNLAVTVPNSVIKDYIELLNSPDEK